MLKTFALRERERPLTVYGPPGLTELMRRCGRRTGGLPLRARARRARARREGRSATATDRAVPGQPRAPSPTATRSSRTPRPGRFDAALAAASSACARAPTSAGCSAARRSAACARAGHGPGARGPQGRALRRHARRARRSRWPRTAPTCSCTRRRSPRRRPSARGETSHRTARQARRARARGRGEAAGADAHLEPLRGRRAARRGACGRSRDTRRPRDFDTIEIPFPERGRAPSWPSAGARARRANRPAAVGQS